MARNKTGILEVRDLNVSYGQVKAVRGVDIDVFEDEIVGLIGANGAGKSTVIKSILGAVKPASGVIRFLGEDITHKKTEKIVASGLALVPEGRGILPMMSVLDNLELGGYHHRKQMPQRLAEVYKQFPVLSERVNQQAGSLSGGEQQMLSIGRALMSNPGLLMLDEPSLGLAPLIVKNIFQSLAGLKQQGCTILLAEQNARQVMKLADRIYVFETGRVAASGTPRELDDDSSIMSAYFGAEGAEKSRG